MPTVTVVIPTLNEAQRLPDLFGSLGRQTRCPDEIVIADAGSTDATRAVAEKFGAVVVDGGKPAAGRNAGARVATSELVLFLDADDELEDDFVESVVTEFGERELAVGTTFVEPIEKDARNSVACEVVNLYLDVMQYVSPHAPGFCILVRRDVHDAISGFDETVVLAEDHDYVRRASERGKFRVLRSCPVRTSMRRIEKEGLIRLAFKYLYCELYVVTGTPIREVPFDYEFAAFDSKEQPVLLEAVTGLRKRLGAAGTAVFATSATGLGELWRLGSTEIAPSAFDETLRDMSAREIARLHRYVGARLRLARRGSRAAVSGMKEFGSAVWRGLSREV